jgi:hypothetical protein
MKGLDNRLKRLEAASSDDMSKLTDAQLRRRLAKILAPAFGMTVEEAEASLPQWERDGTMDAIRQKLETSEPELCGAAREGGRDGKH